MDISISSTKKLNRMTQLAVSGIVALFVLAYLIHVVGASKTVKNLPMMSTHDQEAARNYYKFGMTYLVQRKDNLAAEKFTQAIEADPSFTDAYFERGKLLMKRALIVGDPQAKSDFDKVIELAPDDPKYAEAYWFRSSFYYQSAQWQPFIDDVAKHMELDHSADSFTKAGSYASIAEAYIKLDNIDLVVSNFQKALALYPNMKTRIREHSLVYLVQRRITVPDGESKRMLDKLIEEVSQKPEAASSNG